MIRRLRLPPLGLRTKLTLAIAAILVFAMAVTGLIVYRDTGARLRDQIDGRLRRAADGFVATGLPPGGVPDTPDEVAEAARRWIGNQPYDVSAPVLVVGVAGGGVLSNEPELLALGPERDHDESAAEQRAERRGGGVLRRLPDGFATVTLRDVGPVRVLTRGAPRHGPRAATVTVGEPLAAVHRAQDGVARAFLLVGSITLVCAVLAGWLVAARIAGPLRRMARTATEVDAGELHHRIAASGPRDEVRVLADAFDRMLDRLEEAFARQRDFVADASHELRTPLTVIRGQLEVLARSDTITPADVRRVERAVRTEIARMERLVDDLLELARMEERGHLERGAVALQPFVGDLFDGLTLTAERRFELGDVPAGVIEADPDRLAQVLRNLARNAVEHTARGGLVRLVVRTRPGGELEFAVEDDGPGIPLEQRDRIFDRFHRADASRARTAGGTGLGLAIARAIVEAHGGRIAVGSSPEGGARVAFVLPGFQPQQASARAVARASS